MKTQKMSLANIQGKLSRAEMKNIMAGSGGNPLCTGVVECKRGSEPGDDCFEGCKCSSSLMCVNK